MAQQRLPGKMNLQRPRGGSRTGKDAGRRDLTTAKVPRSPWRSPALGWAASTSTRRTSQPHAALGNPP
jgi:hypothetical protein